MKKLFIKISNIFISCSSYLIFFAQPVFAQAIGDEPARLRSLELVFAQALIVIWALSIPYFMFVISSIGVQWMTAMGDEQKLAQLKQRGGNVILSFALVFGGFLVVKIVIALLGFTKPQDCFADSGSPLELVTDPFFQFFFPEVCTGK